MSSTMANNPLLPGSIAKVSGLKNAQQYNACRGIILAKAKLDQNGNLRHPIHLFKHKGKVLEVRADNLQRSRDLDEWVLPQYGGSMMELIRSKKHIGDEDSCSEFSIKLWGQTSELGPAHPLTIDHRLNLRNMMLEATGHKMYWLALDSIGHHLLIEKCNGAYRVYQAYVARNNYGYTASQWCFGDMRKKPAWTKWGGGKLLADKEVNDLLDLVIKWQKLIQNVVKGVLLFAVPGLNPDAIPYLHRSFGGPDAPMGLVQDAIEHITRWSKSMINRIGPEGCTDIGLDPHTRRISSGRNDVDIFIGYPANGEHIFSIPADMYNQCDTLNREMTGEPLVPATFFLMLNTGVWWEAKRDPDTGSAVGFAFRAMDIDMQLCEEDGLRLADAMTQEAMEDLRSM